MHSRENLQAEVHMTTWLAMFLAVSLLKQHLCLSPTSVVVRKHLCWEGGGFQILGSQLLPPWWQQMPQKPSRTSSVRLWEPLTKAQAGGGLYRTPRLRQRKLVCGWERKVSKGQSSHHKENNVSFSYCSVSVVDGGHSLNLLWGSFHDVHCQIIVLHTLNLCNAVCPLHLSNTGRKKTKQNKDAIGFPVIWVLCCWTLTCDELKDLGQCLSRTKASGIRKTEFR